MASVLHERVTERWKSRSSLPAVSRAVSAETGAMPTRSSTTIFLGLFAVLPLAAPTRGQEPTDEVKTQVVDVNRGRPVNREPSLGRSTN